MIPIITVCISPVAVPDNVETSLPTLVSVNGNSRVYVDGATVSATAVGSFDSTGILNLDITTQQAFVGPLHAIVLFELIIDSAAHVISIEVELPAASNAVSAWFKLAQVSPISPGSSVQLASIAASSSTLQSAFTVATTSESFFLHSLFNPTYSTTGSQLRISALIQIPPLAHVVPATGSEVLKVNIVYFAVVFIIVRTVLKKVYNHMMRERFVFSRRIDPVLYNKAR
jgi:hypothetical protein